MNDTAALPLIHTMDGRTATVNDLCPFIRTDFHPKDRICDCFRTKQAHHPSPCTEEEGCCIRKNHPDEMWQEFALNVAILRFGHDYEKHL
ncbi:MAG: hypothetical protein KBD19_04795 [Candidatus Moranbacteria bacterium]|nr:hypothetical protein [Candidatus Moranbacteria bacterium]